MVIHKNVPSINNDVDQSEDIGIEVDNERLLWNNPNIETLEDEDKTLWPVPIDRFHEVDVNKARSYKSKEFYENQNEVVKDLQEVTAYLMMQEQEKKRKLLERTENHGHSHGEPQLFQYSKQESMTPAEMRYESFCINLSIWTTVILTLVKLGGAVLTLSLSVVATTFESFLDIFTFIILYATNKIRHRRDPLDIYKYPVGKARLEPIGVIIFQFVMAALAVQIVENGAEEIIRGIYDSLNGTSLRKDAAWWNLARNPYEEQIFYWINVGILGFNVLVKVVSWLICRRATYSATAQACALDHFNDALTVSLVFVAVLVSQWVWWFDPAGAIALAIFIIQSWVRESLDHVQNLVGKSASNEFLKRITYIAVNHRGVDMIDSVQAWHVGECCYVEVHIVCPPDMSLKESHDIGEELQLKIEQLPDVERCIVHVDYNTVHGEEHLVSVDK
ncbi:metal tolerance protein [Acrasis kona]|uniref:Metal tolerance protein n=1 Tax=Acrasis kona TaxID=1008807 RepID=A0AAW2ZND7_9EUKA